MQGLAILWMALCERSALLGFSGLSVLDMLRRSGLVLHCEYYRLLVALSAQKVIHLQMDCRRCRLMQQ